MERKKTLLGSMVSMKCPHCREGHLFVNDRTYSFRNLGDVKASCEVCGTNLQPEPGFYFGAAYVSWAITVALWVGVLVALKVFDSLGIIEYSFLTHPGTFLISGMVMTIILFPFLLRLARSMWAHFFIKFDEGRGTPAGADRG